MTLMAQRFTDQLAAAGAEILDLERSSWRRAAMSVHAHDCGLAELTIHSGQATTSAGLIDAIARNPEVGWSFVVPESARVARRLVLAPKVWMRRDALADAIDRFVGGARDSTAAPHRVPLFPLRTTAQREAVGPAAAATALVLLHRASRDLRDTRCVLPLGSETLWEAQLVGPTESVLRSRRRELARALRPLWTRPDIAQRLLDVFINHERNAYAETEE
jgi:hypothetical protein